MLKNHVFGSLNLNNSEIFRLSFEDIFWGTLDIYTKNMNPPSAVLGGGGVHGKVCWLIAYTSWLDHCITTVSGQSIISHVSVIDNVVCSDHFLLCIEVECDIVPLHNSTTTTAVNSSIQWHVAKIRTNSIYD